MMFVTISLISPVAGNSVSLLGHFISLFRRQIFPVILSSITFGMVYNPLICQENCGSEGGLLRWRKRRRTGIFPADGNRYDRLAGR